MIKNPYDIFQPVNKDTRLGIADFSKLFDGLDLHTMSDFFHTLTHRGRFQECQRCINECPKQTIQYGKATADRRRYTIRGYLPQDEQ